MKKSRIGIKSLILSAALSFTAASAWAETEIRLHYAIPTIWAETQVKLADTFMASHPDIKVIIDGAAENYGDGVQRLIRESIAGTAPDVAYVGLNRWRILESRGLLQPLDDFLPEDKLASGYTPALLSLGSFEFSQYALATSASNMVLYVNPDLVAKAGGSMDNFPTDFNGIIELAAKIDALGDNVEGVWIGRDDWRYQSLLGSHGVHPLNEDETDITFDSEAGMTATGLYQRFAKEGGMSSMSENDARQAFPAGTLGMYFESSSLLNRFEEGAAGNFNVTVLGTPVVAQENVYFPTGGSAILMLTDDAEKQKAVWEYIAFVTGPDGQKIVVENTGYAPANKIVLDDESYLGEYYANNANAKVAHAQIAAHAGPWYSYPGAEGVAVTDLIAAALVELTEGADIEDTVSELADTLRDQLKMK